MFRARIGLAAAAVVAALTVGVVLAVGASVSGALTQQVRQSCERAQSAFPTLDLLRGIELTNETARMAREDEFAEALSKSSLDDVRQAAFVAVSARNARLEQQGRKADLIAVVGASGRVLCRDLNINALYDEDFKTRYPSVQKALDGVANKDVWMFDNHMYRVGAAPIRSRSGQIVGALVIGYVSSVKDAAVDRDKLGVEVAYFLDGKVQASSFKREGGESVEEKALAMQLFDGAKLADPALASEMGKVFFIKLGGEEYAGAVGPLTGNLTKSRSGFVVLSSLTTARAPFASLQGWVLVLGLVSLLAVLGAAVGTSLRFIRPLDHFETGVAEVINGNRDYSFESESPDFEGLANGLNVMIARLLGRPDPTDEDTTGEHERWSGVSVEDPVPGAAVSPENASLAAEAEDAYLQRTWGEWTAARKQTGEGVEGMTADAFTNKLRQNEATLRAKYKCRMVRFKVVVKNNQTTLKPVPIN